jgi:hypothetical protein
VAETACPDEVYERVRQQFSEDELAHLSLAIVAINGWNRLNVAARTVPGELRRRQRREGAARRSEPRADIPVPGRVTSPGYGDGLPTPGRVIPSPSSRRQRPRPKKAQIHRRNTRHAWHANWTAARRQRTSSHASATGIHYVDEIGNSGSAKARMRSAKPTFSGRLAGAGS